MATWLRRFNQMGRAIDSAMSVRFYERRKKVLGLTHRQLEDFAKAHPYKIASHFRTNRRAYKR